MRTTNTTTTIIRLSLEDIKAAVLKHCKITVPKGATNPGIEIDEDGAIVSFTYTQEE